IELCYVSDVSLRRMGDDQLRVHRIPIGDINTHFHPGLARELDQKPLGDLVRQQDVDLLTRDRPLVTRREPRACAAVSVAARRDDQHGHPGHRPENATHRVLPHPQLLPETNRPNATTNRDQVSRRRVSSTPTSGMISPVEIPDDRLNTQSRPPPQSGRGPGCRACCRRHSTIQRLTRFTTPPTGWPRTPTSTGGRPPVSSTTGAPVRNI